MEETEKVRVLIGLSLAFWGYIFLVGGAAWILTSIVAGLMALLALMLLFREKFPPRLKGHLTNIAKGLDVGWLALGLGFFGMGIKCLQIQDQIRSAPLVWLGVVFLVVSALLIGMTIGMAANKIIKQSPKVLTILGSMFLVGGLVWLVVGWRSLNTYTLLGRLNGSASPLFIACMGIIFIYYGWRGNRNPMWRRNKQVN